MKAASHLFVTINSVTPYAGIYSITTLCAVSLQWWRILTCRLRVKLALKRHFREICRPFKCSPEQLTGLSADFEDLRVADDRTVNGVSEFNGKLYVICSESDSVSVFVSSPPFSRCDDIRIQGMTSPVDIVTCSDTGQLYIADFWQCVSGE
jgi:hypothetical protein